MRVRNDKAIIDGLGQTKHKADDSDIEESSIKSPKFDSRSAPNLIIQSRVQNDLSVPAVPLEVARNTAISGVYHASPPNVPVYYSKPHPYSAHPPMVIQPVQYVQDYPQ